ncbi:MAG: hypothetical protein JXB32_23710 [Deltaproteobacteria bacterium]|nr:hypothetical protein [Deltaproteobacteria bacterium]
MLRRFPLLPVLPALPVLLGVACLGTPQPDPPNIDPSRVFGYGTLGPPTVLITGEPGAVTPAEATLRIYDLDLEEPAVDVVPRSDGSFEVEVPGAQGDELRLQVTLDEERGTPIDVLIATDRVELASRPLADCLTTSPALEAPVPAGGRATIRLVNGCAQPVAVSRIAVRRPAAPFGAVSPAAPVELPAGGELPIVVEHPAGVDDLAEEILLVEISGPLPDRRPVTLSGTP